MTEPPTRRPAGAASWLPGWWWRLAAPWRLVILAVLAAAALMAAAALLAAAAGAGGTPATGNSASEALAPEAAQPPSGAAAFVGSLPEDREAVWDGLAACETGGDWHADTGNGHYGGLQFTPRSWQAVGGSDLPHQHPREEQILRAELLEDLQGWSAWPSCAAQLGLR